VGCRPRERVTIGSLTRLRLHAIVLFWRPQFHAYAWVFRSSISNGAAFDSFVVLETNRLQSTRLPNSILIRSMGFENGLRKSGFQRAGCGTCSSPHFACAAPDRSTSERIIELAPARSAAILTRACVAGRFSTFFQYRRTDRPFLTLENWISEPYHVGGICSNTSRKL
jgi:hypothetical protein